ncbi:MAG: hypothetical protein RBU37_08095 [Myxococcota bacterium]|nr:hypothetical protein [Myxococcota bacterium]
MRPVQRESATLWNTIEALPSTEREALRRTLAAELDGHRPCAMPIHPERVAALSRLLPAQASQDDDQTLQRWLDSGLSSELPEQMPQQYYALRCMQELALGPRHLSALLNPRHAELQHEPSALASNLGVVALLPTSALQSFLAELACTALGLAASRLSSRQRLALSTCIDDVLVVVAGDASPHSARQTCAHPLESSQRNQSNEGKTNATKPSMQQPISRAKLLRAFEQAAEEHELLLCQAMALALLKLDAHTSLPQKALALAFTLLGWAGVSRHRDELEALRCRLDWNSAYLLDKALSQQLGNQAKSPIDKCPIDKKCSLALASAAERSCLRILQRQPALSQA